MRFNPLDVVSDSHFFIHTLSVSHPRRCLNCLAASPFPRQSPLLLPPILRLLDCVSVPQNLRLRIEVVAVDVFGQGTITMFGAQGRLLRFSERFKFLRTRSFCSSSSNTNNPKTTSTTSTSTDLPNKNDIITDERYQQLENLDMITAAKILFTDPPKKKKFGIDFHLVQLFFACLPSLAVYLVAQYARYDIRKMEAEVEQKRKKMEDEEARKEEEEAKVKEKEMELNLPEEKEAKSDPQFSEVKMRLDKLEEAVKEIVVETKKQSNSNLGKNQVTDAEKKQLNSSAPSDTSNGAASNKAVEGDSFGKHNSLKPKPELGEERKGSIATPNSSLKDPKGQHQGGGAS